MNSTRLNARKSAKEQQQKKLENNTKRANKIERKDKKQDAE